ncbi:MAG: glycosyltransferase [candidate division Zixibacteria bacterium]|nr:glycosyltransferase [candidate division Zixibacteria bacterium]
MRILLISNRYPADADDHASPFVPYFAEAVAARGVHVDVLTPEYGHATATMWNERRAVSGRESGVGTVAPPSVSVFRFPTGATEPVGSWNLLNPLSWVKLSRFLKAGKLAGEKLCRTQRYDHILALWALPSGHFAHALSRKFGIPYSVWCLGSDIYTWARRRIIRDRIAHVLKGATAVFGDGEDLCERIRTWLGIHATFLPSYRPLEGLEDCEPPAPTEAPRYLYLGRLHGDKGILELLRAFAHVRVALPLATLQYVGDGPGKEELEDQAEEMRFYHRHDPDAGSVHIRGAVSHAGVVRALRDCDFVVIPTRSDSVPLVFTEAVQAMRPVIATEVGDLGMLIRRYLVGQVVPSVDDSSLASTMVRMAHQPEFELRGRSELLERFDPKRAAQVFCDQVLPAAGMQAQMKPPETTAKMVPV